MSWWQASLITLSTCVGGGTLLSIISNWLINRDLNAVRPGEGWIKRWIKKSRLTPKKPDAIVTDCITWSTALRLDEFDQMRKYITDNWDNIAGIPSSIQSFKTMKTEEFKLPPKWCVRNNSHKELIDYFNKGVGSSFYELHEGGLFHFPNYSGSGGFSIGNHSSNKPYPGYTEITLEQFKEHVLNKPKFPVEQKWVPEANPDNLVGRYLKARTNGAQGIGRIKAGDYAKIVSHSNHSLTIEYNGDSGWGADTSDIAPLGEKYWELMPKGWSLPSSPKVEGNNDNPIVSSIKQSMMLHGEEMYQPQQTEGMPVAERYMAGIDPHQVEGPRAYGWYEDHEKQSSNDLATAMGMAIIAGSRPEWKKMEEIKSRYPQHTPEFYIQKPLIIKSKKTKPFKLTIV